MSSAVSLSEIQFKGEQPRSRKEYCSYTDALAADILALLQVLNFPLHNRGAANLLGRNNVSGDSLKKVMGETRGINAKNSRTSSSPPN